MKGISGLKPLGLFNQIFHPIQWVAKACSKSWELGKEVKEDEKQFSPKHLKSKSTRNLEYNNSQATL